MERMINNRLTWWMENSNIIDKIQMGFRKGKGCLENLLKVIDVRINNEINKVTTAAFLDVAAAYDNINYKIIVKNLDKAKCPGRIKNFIAKWMEYRIEFTREKRRINY